MIRTAPFLFLTLAFAGCHSDTFTESVLNRSREEKVRCIAIEQDFVLISPFDFSRTAPLLASVHRNLVALESLFAVEVSSNLEVRFEELSLIEATKQKGGDGVWNLKSLERPSRHGVHAFALADPEKAAVTIFVAPILTMTLADGVSTTWDSNTVQTDSVVRHELTHICAAAAQLHGSKWFNEGLAKELESWRWNDDELVASRALPKNLQLARDLHGPFVIEDVLDWKEDVDLILKGKEAGFSMGRPLSQALLCFLLEQSEEPELRDQLSTILAMDRSEFLSQGKAWKSWLNTL